MIGSGIYAAPFVKDPREPDRYVCEPPTSSSSVTLSSVCVEPRKGCRLVRLSIGPIGLLHDDKGLPLETRLYWRVRWGGRRPLPLSAHTTIVMRVKGGRGPLVAAAWFVPMPPERVSF